MMGSGSVVESGLVMSSSARHLVSGDPQYVEYPLHILFKAPSITFPVQACLQPLIFYIAEIAKRAVGVMCEARQI